MKQSQARITREYGPFPGASTVGGVDYDGRYVWLATGDKLQALDPASGEIQQTLNVAADAGTAFDGTHLYQIAEKQIHKIDPKTGDILASLPAPGDGEDSGMAWAEDPPSRTRHLISNVEVEPGERESEVKVYSNFIMYRSRGETEEDFYVGSREDVLRNVDGSWQLASRKIVFEQNVLSAKNLSNFF